jgi:microcystin-dependent protein
MAFPYIGEIRVVAFNFAPPGWLECNGALVSIAEYETLFQLIGTTYGGDGEDNFALPDFRGRVAVGAGTGVLLGEMFGDETVTLTSAQLPAHSHGFAVSGGAGSSNDPVGRHYAPIANATRSDRLYGETGGQSAAINMLSAVGGSQPHENRSPFLGMMVLIATEGIFPPPS